MANARQERFLQDYLIPSRHRVKPLIMAVLRRNDRMAWLDMTCPEAELLRPMQAGSFAMLRLDENVAQAAFAF